MGSEMGQSQAMEVSQQKETPRATRTDSKNRQIWMTPNLNESTRRGNNNGWQLATRRQQ